MNKTPAEVVRELPAEVFVAIARGEGYEDVCDQILAEDAFGPRNPFEWRVVDRAALSAPQGEAYGWVAPSTGQFFLPSQVATTERTQSLIAQGELVRVYTAPPPQQAEQGQAPLNQGEALCGTCEGTGYRDGYSENGPCRCRKATPPQQREGGKVRVTKQMCHRAIDAYTEAVGEGWQMPCVQGMYAALDAVFAQPAQQPGEVADYEAAYRCMVDGAEKALDEIEDAGPKALKYAAQEIRKALEAADAALTTGGRNG